MIRELRALPVLRVNAEDAVAVVATSAAVEQGVECLASRATAGESSARDAALADEIRASLRRGSLLGWCEEDLALHAPDRRPR